MFCQCVHSCNEGLHSLPWFMVSSVKACSFKYDNRHTDTVAVEIPLTASYNPLCASINGSRLNISMVSSLFTYMKAFT